MEDLGEAVENFVETFSCSEEPSSRLLGKVDPLACGNLLAASSNYGYSFAAVRSSIAVYTHTSIRDGGAKPAALVDLAEGNITNIHSLATGPYDTILAHVSMDSKRYVIILNIHALASGKIHALPCPSREVSAFAVGYSGLDESSHVLATLEEGGVQLHTLNAEGSTPSMKISTTNPTCVAVSPDSCLLAVGTERGSIILYNTTIGNTLTTIVEVESGWVPFSVHFADNRAILVSYNCNAEVRHVVWHLSSDGTAVSGHSALGEICLASLSFDSDDDENDEDEAPTITCIPLHEWAMCAIGSSKSGDIEIIKKTDNGWEVWKFDEGKSPTLPNNVNDDDTCCLGLAFDVNNTNPIPGPDAASPKINPMPRIIVYTSDSLLLPFALIDGTPGIECDAVRPVTKLLPIPENLRSIQAVLMSQDGDQTQSEKPKKDGRAIFSDNTQSRPRNDDYTIFPTQAEPTVPKSPGSDTNTSESSGDQTIKASYTGENFKTTASRTRTTPSRLAFSSFESGSNGYDTKGVKSFLGNFSFSETSKADPISPPAITPTPRASGISVVRSQPGPTMIARNQEKRKVMLAPSLQIAQAEATRGDLLGLLKSIMTEMSEELKVGAEAERLVSHEVSSQKDGIVSSITETRKQLSNLLEETRTLFRNEADLRATVSKTLSKVLTMSREYEKISLEFRVREADGFSRSLRTEEKEIDEKISHKETEVIRSITAIEDRLNAETNFQTRRTSPAEVVQQVYSSLSLQGIRIKRIRSLLTALKERMDNQDKGDRLSHLGLSLARLETLNIHDEEVTAQNPNTDGGRKRMSGDREAIVKGSSEGTNFDATTLGIHGDDTQLLSPDVRAVMRRLAMSGGRANITTTISSRELKQDRRLALKEANVPIVVDDPNKLSIRDDVTVTRSGPSEILATSLPVPRTLASGSKSWSTVSTRRPHESIAIGQNGDRHGQMTAPMLTTSDASNSYPTTKTSLKPSDLLPPKKPPSQPPSAPAVQPSSTLGFLSNPSVFDNQQSREATVLSDKPRADDSDFIEVNRSIVAQSENDVFSASTVGFKGYHQGVLGRKTRSGVHNDIQTSDIANSQPSSLQTAPGLEKLSKSSSVPFAGLPSDDDDLQGSRYNKSAPALKKSEGPKSVPFASLPPDEDLPQRVQETTPTPFGKSKRSSPVPFAGLPPDDGIPDKRDSKATVSSLVPGQDMASHAQSENMPPKKDSQAGLFAAFPPELDEEQANATSREETPEKSISLLPQKEKDRTQNSGLFAALPQDSDKAIDIKQSVTNASKGGEGVFSFGSNKAGPTDPAPQSLEKSGGAFGTSDMFASLLAEDGGKEQARPVAAFGTRSVMGNDFGKNVFEPSDSSKVEAPSSVFSDGTASKSPDKESIFGSSFETNQHSSAPFGKASLFGTNASKQQSIVDITEPQVSSSMDAASTDDSDEEPARFGGGMDTSSGTGSLFGASASAQDSKQPFGFGAPLSDGTQTTGFSQSGVSPFGSLRPSQPFGQSQSQSASQAGFGSLTDSQNAFHSSFPTQPAFGETSGFGAASAAPTFGMQSAFGASSQLGAPSSFGMQSQLGASSTPFGSSSPPFGGGMTDAKFGESSFGVSSSFGGFNQNSSGSGFASGFSSSGASPFGQVSGSNGFGGATGGGSGFAALAGSQSGQLVFGGGSGPPSFTSAAFSQRRA